MTACYCDDGEHAKLYIAKMVRAAKPHRCYECHKTINLGEKHEAVRSLYEGHWDTTRTCALCLEVRHYVEAHAPCFCWLHGSLLDDAKDTIREHAHASAGFWIGGMKRVLRAESYSRKGTTCC